MKTLIKIAKAYNELDLPIVQKNIVSNLTDVESLINSDKLNIALNVCFTYHYFFISGTSDENTVTTKHTDGACAPNGSQSKQAENNSYELALILKSILKKVATNMAGKPFKCLNEKAFYNGKRIVGATYKNIYN